MMTVRGYVCLDWDNSQAAPWTATLVLYLVAGDSGLESIWMGMTRVERLVQVLVLKELSRDLLAARGWCGFSLGKMSWASSLLDAFLSSQLFLGVTVSVPRPLWMASLGGGEADVSDALEVAALLHKTLGHHRLPLMLGRGTQQIVGACVQVLRS